MDKLSVGVVGSVGRGRAYRRGLEAVGIRVKAVCDVRADQLERSGEEFGAAEAYGDYEQMLDKSRLDAVVIGTPMPFHVPQSIAALDRGIHVMCEVPAGVSIDECRRLVQACKRSDAVYMMAENFIYTKPNVLIGELVRQGLFGELYYAEGEYVHELKALNEETPWRRTWQTGVAGVTYPTHSLGPILKWMAGDRVVRVCCADVGCRHRDPRGEPYAQTTPVMLCKTARDALIKIRVDMISDRPHSMSNFSLQGTDGAYESARSEGEHGKIWLRALSEEVRWHDIESLMGIDDLSAKYLPAMWRNPSKEAIEAGHGGGDYFEVLDFVRAVKGEQPCPIDVHAAMDLTLPGLVSQQSALQDGQWLDVPDSRQW